MAGRFSPIPDPAPTEVGSWQFSMLMAMKENVELLTGFRGENDGASQAILKSNVTVQPVQQTPVFVQSQGFGTPSPNGTLVPTLDDYALLVSDVRRLAESVRTLQETLNLLITQLRS